MNTPHHPGHARARVERVDVVASRLSGSIQACLAQRALEDDNRFRSMMDRFERGLSVWGAKASRYEPEEEVDEP